MKKPASIGRRSTKCTASAAHAAVSIAFCPYIAVTNTRAREQREPADAFRAGRRRGDAPGRYPEQHDAERDEQRIADRIGQQREGATTSRYVGIQPRQERIAGRGREQADEHPRERGDIVDLPRRTVEHQVGRGPEHHEPRAGAEHARVGRVKPIQRIVMNSTPTVSMTVLYSATRPGVSQTRTGRSSSWIDEVEISMRRYLTDRLRATAALATAGCRRRAATRRTGNGSSFAASGCAACRAGC